jgi:hypothetical protein
VSYLIAAYGITLVALAGYARSLQRERAQQAASPAPTSSADPAKGGR